VEHQYNGCFHNPHDCLHASEGKGRVWDLTLVDLVRVLASGVKEVAGQCVFELSADGLQSSQSVS
jgi:hypothetical protein